MIPKHDYERKSITAEPLSTGSVRKRMSSLRAVAENDEQKAKGSGWRWVVSLKQTQLWTCGCTVE